MLSPESGDRTVVLLGQISQQLAGFQNSTHTLSEDSASFSPSRSMLWVNALWFLSLVTSIVSAFYVMLVQQWIRRYTQVTEDLSNDDGRVRPSLFLGTQKYQMSHAIGFIPLPLHISVFLFFSGLIIFLFTISHTIAIVVAVGVGVFGLAYFVLTILPTLDDICPYFTPMTDVWWYLWHTLLSASAYCLRWPLRRLLFRSMRHSLGLALSPRQRKLAKWLETVEKAVKKHMQRLKGGSRASIVRRAIDSTLDATTTVDLKALTWLLQRPSMADKKNVQNLVAKIPGETLIPLMSVPKHSGKITFREHIFALLESCGSEAVGLDDDVRRSRLLVCLNALHHIVKATFVPYRAPPSTTLLNDVRVNFASGKIMRPLWDHNDPAIRVTSRSICALLARHLLLRPNGREEPELDWLKEVVGSPPNAGDNYFDDIVTVDRMNLKSFVYGVLSIQTDKLSSKDATVFAETLAILMNAGGRTSLSRDIFEEQLTAFVHWTENDDDKHRDEVIGKLRDMLQAFKRHSEQQRRNTM